MYLRRKIQHSTKKYERKRNWELNHALKITAAERSARDVQAGTELNIGSLSKELDAHGGAPLEA